MTHWDGIVIIVFLWSYGFPYENLRFQIYQIVNMINLICKNLRDFFGVFEVQVLQMNLIG